MLFGSRCLTPGVAASRAGFTRAFGIRSSRFPSHPSVRAHFAGRLGPGADGFAENGWKRIPQLFFVDFHSPPSPFARSIARRWQLRTARPSWQHEIGDTRNWLPTGAAPKPIRITARRAIRGERRAARWRMRFLAPAGPAPAVTSASTAEASARNDNRAPPMAWQDCYRRTAWSCHPERSHASPESRGEVEGSHATPTPVTPIHGTPALRLAAMPRAWQG
jgi:hypothetical protein